MQVIGWIIYKEIAFPILCWIWNNLDINLLFGVVYITIICVCAFCLMVYNEPKSIRYLDEDR